MVSIVCIDPGDKAYTLPSAAVLGIGIVAYNSAFVKTAVKSDYTAYIGVLACCGYLSAEAVTGNFSDAVFPALINSALAA